MNIHRTNSRNMARAPVSQPPSDDVCQVLSGILGDGSDVHRCLAARALGRIGAPAAVQPLIAALLDEDEDVRTDAAEALSVLIDPRAGQQLLENLLGDPCAEVKLAAIETLAKLGDRRVTPWLRRMVKGRDEEINWDEQEFFASGWNDWVDVQAKAISALATLNAEEAVPDIVAAMDEGRIADAKALQDKVNAIIFFTLKQYPMSAVKRIMAWQGADAGYCRKPFDNYETPEAEAALKDAYRAFRGAHGLAEIGFLPDL